MPPKPKEKNKSSGSQKSGSQKSDNSGTSENTLRTKPKETTMIETVQQQQTTIKDASGPTPGVPERAGLPSGDDTVTTVPSVASSNMGSLTTVQIMGMFPSQDNN